MASSISKKASHSKPVIVVGATGRLGSEISISLSKFILSENLYCLGRDAQQLDSLSSIAQVAAVDLESFELDCVEALQGLKGQEVDIIWAVAPTLKFKTLKTWEKENVGHDNKEFNYFKNFIKLLKYRKITVRKSGIVLSHTLKDLRSGRGIWGYVADKFLIQFYAETLAANGFIKCTRFFYPFFFSSKSSGELIRFKKPDPKKDKAVVRGVCDAAVDFVLGGCAD